MCGSADGTSPTVTDFHLDREAPQRCQVPTFATPRRVDVARELV
jgi:hypothetical protein